MFCVFVCSLCWYDVGTLNMYSKQVVSVSERIRDCLLLLLLRIIIRP